MLLSARMLTNVVDANTFDYSTQVSFTQGDAPTIYFQLIDAGKDRVEDGFSPSGRRFISATGATLSVVVDTLDDARKVNRVAVQPFAGDPSIWALTFLPTDTIRGVATLRLTLNQGGATTRGSSQGGAIIIESQGAL